MKNPESRAANIGWALIVGGVAAWDMFAPETLSHGVDRALERPYARYAAIGAIAVTSAHLLNVFDQLGIPNADPIAAIGRVVGVE